MPTHRRAIRCWYSSRKKTAPSHKRPAGTPWVCVEPSSPGFRLESSGPEHQILPGSYADSSAQTMVPFSHILWASLWWGIAADAVGKAANFVRGQARQKPGTVPPTATRLAEVSMQLQTMKQNWQSAATDFDALAPTAAGQEELLTIGWALRFNNLKISCSEAAPRLCIALSNCSAWATKMIARSVWGASIAIHCRLR